MKSLYCQFRCSLVWKWLKNCLVVPKIMFPLFRKSNRWYLLHFLFVFPISAQSFGTGGAVAGWSRDQGDNIQRRWAGEGGGCVQCTVCTVQYSVAGWQYSLHPNQLSRHLRPQVAISASALYVRCPAPHTIQRLEILHQIYLGKNQKTSGRPNEDEEDLQRLFLGCIMLYAGQSRNDIMLC